MKGKQGRPAGWSHTEEAKQKMSEKWKSRRPMLPELAAIKSERMSKLWLGQPKPELQRQKMSETRLGIKDTDETKERKRRARIEFTKQNRAIRDKFNVSYSEACKMMRQGHTTDGEPCACNPEIIIVNDIKIYVHKEAK